MTKEDLRKKYERIHFEESDTPRGKLKQNYAKWLEKELIKQLTIPVVIDTLVCEECKEQKELKYCEDCYDEACGAM